MRSRGPVGGLAGMALRARVGRADRRREIGPRDADAVIAPVVHNHVGFRGHVAIDALGAGAAWLMMMMFRDIEFRRQMALRAEPIALRAERQTVRLVAIGAGDAGMIHAALDERAIFEHFAVDLPIGMIEAGLEQGGQIGIEKRRACGGSFAITLRREWHPAQTSSSCEFNGSDALGDAGLGVHSPLVVVGWLETCREPHLAGLRRRIWLRLR